MKNYPQKLWAQGTWTLHINKTQLRSQETQLQVSHAKSSYDKLVLPYSHLYYEGMKVAEYTVLLNSDGQSR